MIGLMTPNGDGTWTTTLATTDCTPLPGTSSTHASESVAQRALAVQLAAEGQ